MSDSPPSDTSEVLQEILEHIGNLNLQENVYLNSVNILKKCFEENEKIKKLKPSIVKDCNIKIKLQNCLDSKECLILINKIEKVYNIDYGHYYNIHYTINNSVVKILKISHLEGFDFFSEKFCRIYKPKVIRFEYTNEVKITYKLEETLKQIVDEHKFNDKYKTFEYDEDDEEESRFCFNHYNFYKEVFQWIYFSTCVNGLEF
jgi:hypothetical protein